MEGDELERHRLIWRPNNMAERERERERERNEQKKANVIIDGRNTTKSNMHTEETEAPHGMLPIRCLIPVV